MKLGVKITVIFILMLLMICFIGIKSYMEMRRLTEANHLVIQTQQVQESLEHILSLLRDAETGQLGFVLTGDDSYLDIYNTATGKVLKEIDGVSTLIRNNPEQQKKVDQLRKLSSDKLDEMKETIRLRRETGMDAALSLIRQGQGKRIIDVLKTLIDQLESLEGKVLDQREAAASTDAQRSMQMLGFGMLLSLLILGISAVFITRTMQIADPGPTPRNSGRKKVGITIQYTFALAMFALATGLRGWLVHSFGPMPLFITWYPAVLLVATIAGGGPGVLVTLLSILAADYWFIEPFGQFNTLAVNDAIATGIFAGTCIFLSVLAERLKRARHAEAVSLTQKKELALLNMGNLMTLDLDHHIINWSEGNRQLYGFNAYEVRGQVASEILGTQFSQPVEEIHSELAEKSHWEGEVTRKTKDGVLLSVALLWALRRDDHGKPLAILEVSTDITRQKHAEEMLQQQAEELAQQNEELSIQTEEMAQQSEELSEQNEELLTQSEEIQTLNTELGQRERMLQMLLDAARLPIGEREVMKKICNAALEMIGADATGAVVCEAHESDLCILAHAGFEEHAVPGCWPIQDSFIEKVIEQNRTAALEDTSLRPDFNILTVDGLKRFSAVLSTPLHLNGKCIGAVSIYSNKPQQWTSDQFRLIEWVAAKCSNSLETMRLAEEVLQSRKQNDFLANIIQSSSQAFGVGYPDGHLGLINKEFEKLTGYSGEELRSIDWSNELTPPEWFEIERLKLEELHRTGLPVRYEKEYIRKDGSRVPIELLVHFIKDEKGNPLYYYSFINDITERKAAEKALRLSEEKFAIAFANNPAAIALTRLEDGLFLDVNNTWVEMNGYSRDEVIGLYARKLKIWPTPEAAAKFVQELQKKGALHGWEQGFFKRSGEIFVAQLSATVLNMQGEKFILSTFIDITERKKIEEELRKSHDELELRVRERTSELSAAVDRLEQLNLELQEFAHVTSHDLQEPLRKIQTFCDLVKTRSAPLLDSAGQEYLDRVINSASRMRQLLGDLLQLSRLSGRLEPFQATDMNKIAHEAADLFEEDLKKSGGVVEIQSMPVIDADETQMLRLFQNLIGNAVKYRGEKSPRIIIHAKQIDGSCELFIKDNGIGFAQESAERIFKPFQRLHGRKEYEGTGMGLAICRKIVERHGGAIKAESEPRKGAIFSIILPVKHKKDKEA